MFGIFKSKKKCKINYFTFTNGIKAEYNFLSYNKNFKIVCDVISSDNKIIAIPLYDPRIGRFTTLGYEEKEFIDDIENILEMINKSPKGDNLLYHAFETFILSHIKQFKRIIDTDLFRIIAEFILVFDVLSVHNGINISNSDRIEFTQLLTNNALTNFSEYFYITKYKRNMSGTLEPYLEKYK